MRKYKESLFLVQLDQEDLMEILELLVPQVQKESEVQEEIRVLLVLQENRDVSIKNVNVSLIVSNPLCKLRNCLILNSKG